jgi:predicted short-subunit dehydrogenase-like oxidoreductase (DUF2520 family)
VVSKATAWIRDWTETEVKISPPGNLSDLPWIMHKDFTESDPMPPTTNPKENIAIIGLGRAGTAIGYLLRRAGYPIVAVSSRTSASINERSRYTGGRVFTAESNAEAASLASCIFITTPDDIIASVCSDIADKGGIRPGDKVIHMSGAAGLDLLDPARKAGAHVASIHPLQSFADVEGAIRNIPLSTFGITAEEPLRVWSADLVRELGGVPFEISEDNKPLYHALACIASNYLTTLINMVEEAYISLGLDKDEARRAFWPLVAGTLKNIERRGSVQALTGPISRGDAGTIERHIAVFRRDLSAYLPVYASLGLMTVDLARRGNTLTVEKAELIKNILKKDES